MRQRNGRRVLRLGVLILGLLSVRSTTLATCAEDIYFGQFSEACAGGTAYCYVVSPGGMNNPDSIHSFFWSLTTGNPTIGPGDDNGSLYDEDGWLRPYGPGTYLYGSWMASSEIDGCIAGQIPPGKPAEVMAVNLSDQDHYGEFGFFAVASVFRHPAGWPQFDFAGGLARDITLSVIPPPRVLLGYLGSGRWQLGILPPLTSQLVSGFYSDGSTTLPEVIPGYRIHRRDAQPEEGPPTDRSRSMWTPETATIPLSQGSSFVIDCGFEQFVTYLSQSLVFDSGFETGHVSESLELHLCDLWWYCPPEFTFDWDGDGFYQANEFGCPLDCEDLDSATYPGAPETNDGTDNQCGGPGWGIVDEISGLAGFLTPWDKTAFTWRRQSAATLYEVARSGRPDSDSPCLTLTTESTTWADPEMPDPEHGYYYLVRAVAPHLGSWGQDSSGNERTSVCP